ncbi:MAG: adenylyltransferase/cytidyltransferase family protein [Acidimicrobiia bacterium]
MVLCHGRFDPLHVGHVLHFLEAKAHGVRLVVTVTPDRFAATGPGRPSHATRAGASRGARQPSTPLKSRRGIPTAAPAM